MGVGRSLAASLHRRPHCRIIVHAPAIVNIQLALLILTQYSSAITSVVRRAHKARTAGVASACCLGRNRRLNCLGRAGPLGG